MRKIVHGLLWFQLLLMNVGLALGTIGLVAVAIITTPLIETGFLGVTLGLLFVFFYVLLLVGVVGIDLMVQRKGIKYFHDLTKKKP